MEDGKIGLHFGALSEPLHKQLRCLATAVEQYQKDVEAVCRLHLRGLLSAKETENARKRILKSLAEDVSSGKIRIGEEVLE